MYPDVLCDVSRGFFICLRCMVLLCAALFIRCVPVRIRKNEANVALTSLFEVFNLSFSYSACYSL
jgi:hypothetical protein